MTITNNSKEVMETKGNRTLYKITEVYNDESSYHGYYVESKAGKGQAYRFKTVKNNVENIEDQDALSRATNTLITGFTF